MTAQEANTAAKDKIATSYTYTNLQALISQEANNGKFSIASNTEGYNKEYDQFLSLLTSDGYNVKVDYIGFVTISWDDESIENQTSTSTSTTETTSITETTTTI